MLNSELCDLAGNSTSVSWVLFSQAVKIKLSSAPPSPAPRAPRDPQLRGQQASRGSPPAGPTVSTAVADLQIRLRTRPLRHLPAGEPPRAAPGPALRAAASRAPVARMASPTGRPAGLGAHPQRLLLLICPGLVAPARVPGLCPCLALHPGPAR